jgi:hypothetical protein
MPALIVFHNDTGQDASIACLFIEPGQTDQTRYVVLHDGGTDNEAAASTMCIRWSNSGNPTVPADENDTPVSVQHWGRGSGKNLDFYLGQHPEGRV